MKTWIVFLLGCGNYSRVETVQGRKLFAEIRYVLNFLFALREQIHRMKAHRIAIFYQDEFRTQFATHLRKSCFEFYSQKISNLNYSGQYYPMMNFVSNFCLEVVFCYQNCSDLLWEKNVLVIVKTFEIRGWRPRICKNFDITRTILFKQWKVITIFGDRMLFNVLPEVSQI